MRLLSLIAIIWILSSIKYYFSFHKIAIIKLLMWTANITGIYYECYFCGEYQSDLLATQREDQARLSAPVVFSCITLDCQFDALVTWVTVIIVLIGTIATLENYVFHFTFMFQVWVVIEYWGNAALNISYTTFSIMTYL